MCLSISNVNKAVEYWTKKLNIKSSGVISDELNDVTNEQILKFKQALAEKIINTSRDNPNVVLEYYKKPLGILCDAMKEVNLPDNNQEDDISMNITEETIFVRENKKILELQEV